MTDKMEYIVTAAQMNWLRSLDQRKADTYARSVAATHPGMLIASYQDSPL